MVSAETSRAQMLDGRVTAEQIKHEVAVEVGRLLTASGVKPRLAAVLVGDDDASAVYVRNKVRACAEVGIESEQILLPASTSTAELLAVVARLNQDQDVDGILVQLPLPKQIDEASILEAVDPAKDVDGFHPSNVGLLAMGRPRFVPCTPAGIIELLDRNQIEIAGDECLRRRPQSDRGQAGGQLVIAETCHGNYLPFKDARSSGRDATGGHPGGGDRPARFHPRRLHQTGRGGDRCRGE